MKSSGATRKVIFLSALSVSFWTTSALPAELILNPFGTMLRSISSWERVDGVEYFGPEGWQGLRLNQGVFEGFLPKEKTCLISAYRTLSQTEGEKEVDLRRLCQIKDRSTVDFLFISDTQENHDENAKTSEHVSRLVDENPDMAFVLSGGDLVQEATLTEWQRYRHAAEAYSSKIPIVPVIGNHDYRGDPQLSFFRAVYGTPETQSGYSMTRVGPINLIVLNSNMSDMAPEARTVQDQWLLSALSATKAEKRVPVIAFHHAPYTSGYGIYYMPANPKYIREKWVPLFENFGVKLVLMGHEHLFERLIVNGITYLAAGPAAGKLSPKRLITAEGSQICVPQKRTITQVSVTREHFRLTTIESGSGTVLDKVTFATH